MKPLVIYHHNCADGFGAAFAAWLKFGEEAEYLPMSYGDIDLDSKKIELCMRVTNREVYILDFSFSREMTESIISLSSLMIWLDHHRTAFEMWCPGEYNYWGQDAASDAYYIKLDNNKSGALLAWEYFNPGVSAPVLFNIIDDRDRWQFKYPITKPITAALFASRPWSFEQWNSFTDSNIENLLVSGEAILSAEQSMISGMLDREPIYCTPNGITGPIDIVAELPMPMIGFAINTNVLISDIGNELAKRSGTFGLVWYMEDDVTAKCSLRSIGDYDVSGLAKCFGGGGHKNAAGFEIDVHKLLTWFKK